MDAPSRFSIIAIALFILSSIAVVAQNVEAAGPKFDENIIVGFDEYWMDQELAPDYTISLPLPIHWYARDPNGLTLLIDIYIRAEDSSNWIIIIEGSQNSGTYVWDLLDPYVPDGEYTLKVLARNYNCGYSYNISTFSFRVRNKERPDVEIETPLTGMECSGEVRVSWDVVDRDTSRYLIHAAVFLSADDGINFEKLYDYQEDPGWCILDTTVHTNGDQYRFRVEVKDPDGLYDSDVSGRFEIFNNVEPLVNITHPVENEGLSKTVRIKWDSDDPNEPIDRLSVDLWYVTVHNGARVDLLKGASNKGYYDWDTSKAAPGGEGHFICIQLHDSHGGRSDVDKVLVWIFRPDDRIILDVQYPKGTVKDEIRVTWSTYKPAVAVSDRLVLTVYHKEPGSDMCAVAVQVEDGGEYSIDVSSGPDGFHQVRFLIMDPARTWIYDEYLIDAIYVYHEMEPQMFIRGAPSNGTNLTSNMEFDVAGFDQNGDILSYMGLYCQKGGGWQVFDIAYGGYKQRLFWNTTIVPPGEYEVRIAVYDGSLYNLSTSKTLGPYYRIEERTPSGDMGSHAQSGNSFSPLVISVIVLSLILIMIISAFLAMLRKDRGRISEKDIASLRMKPEYAHVFFRKTREGGLFERFLPSKGGSSARDIILTYNDGSTGLSEDEKADLQGYLDMLDPDLVDDVTRSDLDSYGVLGVGMDASEDEINRVFREYVKRFHPDRFAGKGSMFLKKAEEVIRKRNRAKSILLDHRKRAVLDRMLRESEGDIIRSASLKSLDQLKNLGKSS